MTRHARLEQDPSYPPIQPFDSGRLDVDGVYSIPTPIALAYAERHPERVFEFVVHGFRER